MPCCCKQRRRASDTPLIYGRNAVDFISDAGSLLVVCLLVFVMLCTNEYGYPFETRNDNKCFFFSEITDGLIMRCFVRSYKHLSTPFFTD